MSQMPMKIPASARGENLSPCARSDSLRCTSNSQPKGAKSPASGSSPSLAMVYGDASSPVRLLGSRLCCLEA